MKSLKVIIGAVGGAALIAGCSATPSQIDQEEMSTPASGQVTGAKVDPVSKAVTGGSSVSLAHSYKSLEELEAVSVLIAEVNIKDVHSTDPVNDATFYNATVTDVLKGTEGKEIILTQVGIEEEREKTGELQMDRENPIMQSGNSYILFLKAGKDERVGPLYYVAGEYQGKYQGKYEIQDQQVFSVNQDEKTKALVSGEDVTQFKEKIKDLVRQAQAQ
ncbi:hypothetical protein [Paenibacillus sp. IHBB 10380]|uniref:hypothetical protein n=1 Tax=Paenibacillus sp. IHBB 10380 TaxID=1566358 RepID=UPI0005CFC332|nr:hypothetical protein [Paenibacillus sp. IHBB 10380]AJS59046.1 hypothetical protein UB51_11925 [Paenibacillus sp. IHBB 10380]